MNAELTDLVSELIENRGAYFTVPLRYDFAHCIVPVGIRHDLDQVLVDLLNDSLLISVLLSHRNDDLNHAEAIAVRAKLIEVLEYLFKNEVLHVDGEALTLKNFSDDMRTLIVLGEEEDFALK